MSTKLFLQERREQIITLLEREGRVSVAALSERFDLSQATIRSDLDALAAQGLLIRTHGGAIGSDRTDLELSFEVRRRLYSSQKQHIAAAAAAMVEDGEAIAADASTTVLALADRQSGSGPPAVPIWSFTGEHNSRSENPGGSARRVHTGSAGVQVLPVQTHLREYFHYFV